MTSVEFDPLVVPPPSRLGSIGSTVLRGLLAALKAAEGRQQLHELSDDMLQDVGLTRDQIGGALQADARRLKVGQLWA